MVLGPLAEFINNSVALCFTCLPGYSKYRQAEVTSSSDESNNVLSLESVTSENTADFGPDSNGQMVDVVRPSGRPLGPIRCSVCHSAADKNGSECIDNPKKFEKDCIAPIPSQFGPYTGCRKIELWIDNDINGSDPLLTSNYRVIRKCAYFANSDGRECIHSGSMGARQVVCFCQLPGCNSGHPLTQNVFLILLSTTAMTFVLLHATNGAIVPWKAVYIYIWSCFFFAFLNCNFISCLFLFMFFLFHNFQMEHYFQNGLILCQVSIFLDVKRRKTI